MKRGKDDEKMVEPMFPRLHVNDADKGGPRAPPRNKMALYEQLSIPSQRFNRHGLVPVNASNTSSSVPPGSSTQACGMERNLYFQHQLSSSAPVNAAEKLVPQKPHRANVRSFSKYDQRKTAGEEDDFMVPVFINSGRTPSHVKTKIGIDKEKSHPIIPISSQRSVEIKEASGRDLKQNGSLSACSRPEARDASKGDRKQDALLNSLDLSAREVVDAEKSALKCDRLNGGDACLRQESRNRFDQDGGEISVKDTDNAVDSQSRSRSHSGEGRGSPEEVDKDREYHRSRIYVPLEQRNGEVSDGVSETSMVDSISSTDISPDDVVGLIGQQRFWKARRAIANQQRIFAVQVFELHRLVKVQRLIAASPHLLLDDGTFLGKSSSKTSPVKNILPPEFIVKPLPRAVLHKDDSKAANHHRMECSAENAVGRATTLSSGKNNNVNQSANACPPPLAADAQMSGGSGGGSSWCLPPQPHPGNHQWLVPVMSPSEGLIYKPYPGTGLAGSICGAHYGHFIPTTIPAGNFVGGPAYGVPAPPIPYNQSFSFPPGLSYFPPYGVPAANSGGQPNEQMNQFGYPGNITSAALTAQQQSSCNFSNAKNSNAASVQPPLPPTKVNKDSGQVIQGSSGSSPGERGARIDSENAFRLFPTAPAADNASLETMPTTTAGSAAAVAASTAPRVIRVVPHNRTVASESAARIFRSIQEERKQYESV